MPVSFVRFLIENTSRLDFIKKQHEGNRDFGRHDHEHPDNHPFEVDAGPEGEWDDGMHDPDEYHASPAEHKTFVHHAVDRMAGEMDPSPQKKYTQYLANQYKKESFRLEDAPRVKEVLQNFDTHRSRLEKKDINQYRNFSDLEDTVNNHIHGVQEKSEKFPDGPRFDHPEAKKVFDNGQGLTVHHLTTKAAGIAARDSCGHKTTSGGWCFGWKGHQNMFDDYNHDGPIHLIQTPDNRKYAIHQQSDQLMDKDDRPVDLQTLIAQHPDLKNVKEFKQQGVHSFPFMHHEEQLHALENGTPSDVQEAIKKVAHQDPEHLRPFFDKIATNPSKTNDAASWNAGGRDYYDTRLKLASVGSDRIKGLISRHLAPHGEHEVAKWAAWTHNPEVHENIMKHPDSTTRRYSMSHIGRFTTNPQHLRQIYDEVGEDTHGDVIAENPHTPIDVLKKLIHGPYHQEKSMRCGQGSGDLRTIADVAHEQYFKQTGTLSHGYLEEPHHRPGSFNHFRQLMKVCTNAEMAGGNEAYKFAVQRHTRDVFQRHFPGLIQHAKDGKLFADLEKTDSDPHMYTRPSRYRNYDVAASIYQDAVNLGKHKYVG